MVLCQIIVDQVGSKLYPINIYGKKKVKICRVDYRQQANNDKTIYLESNILRLPYGNFPYFTMMSNPNHQISNVHSDLEFQCDFNGNLDIAVKDIETLASANGFVLLILTIDISNVE